MDQRRVLKREYMANRDRLFSLAFALTGDEGMAEDVVHDVFASLVEQPWRLRGVRRLRAYLSVCTRNRALNAMRERKQRQAAQPAVADRRQSAGLDDPSEQMERREDRERLLRALNGLPDDLRDVLSLRIWGALSFRRIAALSGVATSTVHARYRQALRTAREHLGEG